MDWHLLNTIVLLYIPHGHCYLWENELVILHAASDALIALAYFSIPCTLGHFVLKRKDLPYPWLFGLFGAFIVSCGMTHLLEIWTLWHPTYWLSGSAKAFTATVSLFTALQLIPVVPEALALKSPAELETANQALKAEITERQQIESRLYQNQQLLNNSFEFALIGKALLTPEGDWIRVNPALCNLVGYSETELLQTNFRDITFDEDLSADPAYIEQLLSGKTNTCQFEKRYIHKQGHLIWALQSVSLVRDSEGNPINFIAQIQDITERKQAEQALQEINEQLEQAVKARTSALEQAYSQLKESEAQYQDLYDNAPDMYVSVSAKTKEIVRCNQTLTRELGYHPEEVLGRPIFSMYHPDCLPEVEKAFQQFVETGEVKDAQLVLQRKDGSPLDVSLNVYAIRDESGLILYSCSSWRDITERKRLESQMKQINAELEQRVHDRTQELQAAYQSLQQSQERLELALEGSGDGLWDWDITTGALYLSPQWLAMLGYKANDLSPTVKTWEQLVHPEDNLWVMKLLSEHLRDTAKPYAFDYRVKTKSGEWKWIGNYGKVVAKDAEGNPVRMAGMHKDISIRKQREEQIKASLQEKEVMLQEIHHRVKNNLQVISSLLNLQARNISDPDTLEVFKESQNRVSSMALVHEKLYQSKNLDRINFGDYVQDLLKFLTRSYQSYAHRINLSIDIENVVLKPDAAISCGLVVNELVSNSFKYAFPNTQNAEIKIAMHRGDDSSLQLVVADNGVGIPPDMDWRKSRSLGLRLVSNLTRQLSGSMELLRQEGTVFRMTFPEIAY